MINCEKHGPHLQKDCPSCVVPAQILPIPKVIMDGATTAQEEWDDETIHLQAKAAAVAAAFDIKSNILTTAGNIVNGARRSAYGTPERNFSRIAIMWNAWLEASGITLTKNGESYTIQASDVSPLMRLIKEARLCESPNHLDSFVDIVGYALTGAEVNGVKE